MRLFGLRSEIDRVIDRVEKDKNRLTPPIFTGIGSRKTPPEVLEIMKGISAYMDRRIWVLRSGGADGADAAFESGWTSEYKEIYLPWKNFNGNPSPLHGASANAKKIAAGFTPYWGRLTESVQNIKGRNVYQILGRDLASPTHLVICWTEKGEPVGGTGLAIKIAECFEIPVINLWKYFS